MVRGGNLIHAVALSASSSALASKPEYLVMSTNDGSKDCSYGLGVTVAGSPGATVDGLFVKASSSSAWDGHDANNVDASIEHDASRCGWHITKPEEVDVETSRRLAGRGHCADRVDLANALLFQDDDDAFDHEVCAMSSKAHCENPLWRKVCAASCGLEEQHCLSDDTHGIKHYTSFLGTGQVVSSCTDLRNQCATDSIKRFDQILFQKFKITFLQNLNLHFVK